MESSIPNRILLVFALLGGVIFVITIMLVKRKTYKKSQHLEKCSSSELDGTDSPLQINAKLIPDMAYYSIG